MLFYRQFFHQDARCPDKISETVVKYRQGEKQFNVSDCQDDRWDMALETGFQYHRDIPTVY